MRLLGLDLGTKTLGVAMSDKTNTIASPYTVLRYSGNTEELIGPLQEIIAKNDISTIVLGLPKNMDNSLGFAAKRSMDFQELLKEHINIPIVLLDERLTTVEAENMLIAMDVKRKKRKEVIDGVAARIILETYMRNERK